MIVFRNLQCVLNRQCFLYIRACTHMQGCKPAAASVQLRYKSDDSTKLTNEESTIDENKRKLKKEEAKSKQKVATDKLNSLIASLEVSTTSTDSSSTVLKKLNLNLAKPLSRRKSKVEVKQEGQENKRLKKKKEEEEVKDGIDVKLAAAAKTVAASLGGDVEKTESELLQKLRQHSQSTNSSAGIISDKLFEGMLIEPDKVDKLAEQSGKFARDGVFREQSRTGDKKAFPPRPAFRNQALLQRPRVKIDLFGSGSLKIFKKETEKSKDEPKFPELNTWDELERKYLESLVSHPPNNGFEEMIIWTNQNKIWKFPIDNEQGLDDEAKVGFHEHVFLDYLLEEGFPKKGPVRHYMELVTTGLSKNPYMTVKEKHGHIDWYREYFNSKGDILTSLGINE